MSALNFVFAFFLLVDLVLIVLLVRRFLRTRALGTFLLALAMLGLVYDNVMLAFGGFVGEGVVLEGLNRWRYVLHAALTPLYFIVAVEYLRRAQFTFVRPWLRVAVFVLAGVVVLFTVPHALRLPLEPAAVLGVLRYKVAASLLPAERLATLIPAFFSMLLFLVVGILLWVRLKWPWVCLAAVLMTLLGGVQGETAFFISALGETILFTVLVLTEHRV